MRCAVALTLAVTACSATPTARTPTTDFGECRPLPLPTVAWDEAAIAPATTGKLVFVTVEGARRVPRSLYGAAIESRAGAPLDPITVRSDLRRLLALEVLSDARADVREVDGGVVLTYVLTERPPIHAVSVRGVPEGPALRPVVPSPGEPYDAAQIARQADRVGQTLLHAGYLDATARSGAARRADGGIDVCIQAAPGRRYVVGSIVFSGNEMLSDETLTSALAGEDPDAKENRPGGPPRPDLLDSARWRLEAPYLERGMLNARVAGPRLMKHPKKGTADLLFSVEEGPVFHVGKVTITGVPKHTAKKLLAALSLKPGSIARRSVMVEAVQRVRVASKKEVDVKTSLDSETRTLNLELEVTGP